MNIDLILELFDLIGNSNYKLLVYGPNSIAIGIADGTTHFVYDPIGEDNEWQACIDWMRN